MFSVNNLFNIAYFLLFRHVQVNNEEAIEFYKKFGFEIKERKENYYKRIEPADAYVLQKTFRETNVNGTENEKKKSEQNEKFSLCLWINFIFLTRVLCDFLLRYVLTTRKKLFKRNLNGKNYELQVRIFIPELVLRKGHVN